MAVVSNLIRSDQFYVELNEKYESIDVDLLINNQSNNYVCYDSFKY